MILYVGSIIEMFRQIEAAIAVDLGQWTVDSCFVKEIKPFLLWAIGSIHEVIYVLTAVAIAILSFRTTNLLATVFVQLPDI